MINNHASETTVNDTTYHMSPCTAKMMQQQRQEACTIFMDYYQLFEAYIYPG